MSTNYYDSEKFVNEYVQMAADVDSHSLIREFEQYLTARSKVLEIGTGPGTDYAILSKRFDVLGSDYSVSFLNYLNKKYPKGRFIELNAITLDIDQSFDGIYSNKVLHHLSDKDLRTSISRQASILQPGGVIGHSFWKGEGDELFKGMLVNYQNKASFQALFGKYFDILLLKDYTEFEENDSIFLVARKKSK